MTRKYFAFCAKSYIRTEVQDMFLEMHQYYQRGYTPKSKYSKACQSCSLKDICLPKMNRSGSVKEYISKRLTEEEE